jgi:hypothetical protein
MTEDRFVQRGWNVYDVQTEQICNPTATLMAYANAWARLMTAYRDDDESIGNVFTRAELEG